MPIGKMRLSEFVKMLFPERQLTKHQTKVLDATKPKCFGEQPPPWSNIYAENCCHDCPFGDHCTRATNARKED